MLHDSKLYLPALPQQYQADRLLQLFQNQKVCCSDRVVILKMFYKKYEYACIFYTE